MELETARKLLAEGQTLEALSCFERAYRREPHNPDYQSYFGLLTALERGQISRAVSLCSEAVDKSPQRADFRLNLARVYLKARDKREAVRYLRDAMRLDPGNPEILRTLDGLGFRGRPVVPWLPRGHFVNKWLGLWGYRLGFRRPRPDPASE